MKSSFFLLFGLALFSLFGAGCGGGYVATGYGGPGVYYEDDPDPWFYGGPWIYGDVGYHHWHGGGWHHR